MRLTLVALLLLCGFLCTGCESLNKTARWPHKDSAITEQLANDQKRREATEQQIAQGSLPEKNAAAIQQTNFAPGTETPDATLLKALRAEEARQNQLAKSLYEQVLAQQPQNARAHHRLGVLADQEGRYPEAQVHYQAALQQQPQNASLLSDVGYSLYSQDRLDEAEQYMKAALQLQPENQVARNNLAQVYGRRAQQTGSPADYKLAEEQFQLALGPQGAEQQMQQMLPPAGTAADERRSMLNPFKKRGAEKVPGRMASNLQAPNPKEDGNAALVRQMEEIRAQMERNGELPAKRPQGAIAQRPTGTNPPTAIPFNQVNSELSRIDQEASRRQAMALRRGYPTAPHGAGQGSFNGGNSSGNIAQVGGWENADSPAEAGMGRYPQDGINAASRDPYYAGQRNQPGSVEQPGDWNNRDPNAPYPGSSYFGQTPIAGSQGNPNAGSNSPANEGTNDSQLSQSWPDRQGAPTQFDARGQNWDGQSILSNSAAGNSVNMPYEPNDPTYNSGTGRSFGAQRPTGQSRSGTNARGAQNAMQAGWDDGRQAAAQLGLDAGMGDMFPAGAGDSGLNDRNQMTNSPNGNWNNAPRQAPWQGTNAAAYADPTTPRGMSPGGTGTVAPADYYSAPPGFQNDGYSQGINPAMGENYGNAGGDVTAPWNQPGMSPRNSRPAGEIQYGNDAGQATGRFAPSRQSSTPPQNFGAPPMYYGR